MSVTHGNEGMRQIVFAPGHVDVASLHMLRRRDIWVEGEGGGGTVDCVSPPLRPHCGRARAEGEGGGNDGDFYRRLMRVRERG